jgi:spore maturation protein CgeB
MRITIFGSSIVSSYWNGAATYYRGICKALSSLGHEIVFVEPDAYGRQQHRDMIEDPDYVDVRVTRSWEEMERELKQAETSDLVAKCSGVGVYDMELEQSVSALSEKTLTAFWDVDAPTTLEQAFSQPDWYFNKLVPRFDAILTYGGGPPVQQGYSSLGAKAVHLVYNAMDPDEYQPVIPSEEFRCDLMLMANRLPDREERIKSIFFKAAEMAPEINFILGGEGWGDYSFPPNVRYIGHVPTALHTTVNSSADFVLNINRLAMVSYGYSPPTRVFEAAGCAACLITDYWQGIEQFLEPDREVLVIRDACELVDVLRNVSPERAEEIGKNAYRRVISDHTYQARAKQLDKVIKQMHKCETQAV